MQPLSRAELEALPAQRPAQDKRVCRDWDTGNLMTTPDWLRAKYPQQVTLEQARQVSAGQTGCRTARAQRFLDALSCPPAIAERSAIIKEGDYCDRDAAGHRLRIAAALKELPPPRDHNGRRLIAETRRFLGSNWFPLALECGWTLDELFGVDALAPLERFEQWGLVVGLALAPKPGDMIEHLDAEHAVIRYRVGALLKEGRRNERRFVPEVLQCRGGSVLLL